ncbi:MAG: uroporphyrinogen decarboxylase family protein [Thermoproteota archaeon]
MSLTHEKLSSRERALSALQLKESDRVPMFELEFQYPEEVVGKRFLMTGVNEEWERVIFRGVYENMIFSENSCKITEYNVSALVETCKKLGYDIIRPVFVPDLLKAIEFAKKISPDHLIMGSSGGLLGIPDGRSAAEVVRKVYTDRRAFSKEVMQRTNASIEWIRMQLDAGADLIMDCTDLCLKEGPFFRPSIYDELVFPCLKMEVEATHRGGAFFVMHTDGYLWPRLDGIVKTGIDALHSIDPSAGMRISDVKERYGDRIALCGNVDAATVLAYGSPADVVREARSCIREGAHGEGYFLTSSNCIYRGVPLANALALCDTGIRYGKYTP